MAPLTIWTNAFLTDDTREDLRRAAAPHRLLVAAPTPDVLAQGAPDATMHEAEVAFGQPDPETLVECPRLQWVHLSSAGYSRYETPRLRELLAAGGLALTNSSAVYAEPCAQHALAFLLASARQLHAAHEVQRTSRAWHHTEIRSRSRLLGGETILLVGFGSIGARLAELLAPFGARVIGVRRSRREDGAVKSITVEDLPKELPNADHVVNILPDNASSRHFFDSSRFKQCKPGATYYSIGRGTTTDQDALLASLRSRHLAAAYLDVTDPEPLPPEHPLWTEPDCFITPHSSGGHATESTRLVEHFLQNLRRFERGEPLVDQVEF